MRTSKSKAISCHRCFVLRSLLLYSRPLVCFSRLTKCIIINKMFESFKYWLKLFDNNFTVYILDFSQTIYLLNIWLVALWYLANYLPLWFLEQYIVWQVNVVIIRQFYHISWVIFILFQVVISQIMDEDYCHVLPT